MPRSASGSATYSVTSLRQPVPGIRAGSPGGPLARAVQCSSQMRDRGCVVPRTTRTDDTSGREMGGSRSRIRALRCPVEPPAPARAMGGWSDCCSPGGPPGGLACESDRAVRGRNSRSVVRGGVGMKIVVDLTRCQGYAQCAFAAPDVFTMRGDEALLYNPDPDDAARDKVVRAAAACPVQAILLDPGDNRRRQSDPRGLATDSGHAGEAFKRTGRIVIVGASLAGLRAGYTLRNEGFTGSLTVIGEEPYAPYDRPPLSKQVLLGQVPSQGTELPGRDGVDAHWRLGIAATGLDPTRKQV